MDVRTVTTSDGGLLRAVRATLNQADEVLLCVAFVHERGLHLLELELKGLRRRSASARLLVTTTFQMRNSPALGIARDWGLEVRILNPGSGKTFHPKLYLGAARGTASAVIGSANLTGGLATNYEAAVALDGARGDAPIKDAWDWAETLWSDERVERWVSTASETTIEPFEPELYELIRAEVRREPTFNTLGPIPRGNRVSELTPVEIHIETERSRRRSGGAEPIPAWMFNLAWDRLRTHGSLTNKELLDLRVHRSSAVCAILARLPGVKRGTGPDIVLEYREGGTPLRS